jgi:hypothetical protein
MDARHIITVLHGWCFGAVFVVGFPLALVALAGTTSSADKPPSVREQQWLARGLWLLSAIGWLTVLGGAYVIYPWYRAKPPAGLTDLALYPRSLLLSHPDTQWLHSVGMEWKEHVSWLAPMILTMVAYIYTTYGAGLSQHTGLRRAFLTFTLAAFAAAGVSGIFGKALNNYAPVISTHQVATQETPNERHASAP